MVNNFFSITYKNTVARETRTVNMNARKVIYI